MSKKELYVAPELEVLELRLEGVIASSTMNQLPEITDGGDLA